MMKRATIISLSLIFLLFFTVTADAQNQKSTIWGVGEGGKAKYNIITKIKFESLNISAFPGFEIENYSYYTMKILEEANDGYRYELSSETNTSYGLVTFKSFDTANNEKIVFPIGDFPFLLPLAYGRSDDFLKDLSESWTYIKEMSFLFGNETKIFPSSNLNDSYLNLDLSMYMVNVSLKDASSFTSFIPFPTESDYMQQINMTTIALNVSLEYAKKTGLLFDVRLKINGSATLLIPNEVTHQNITIPGILSLNSSTYMTEFIAPGNVETREKLDFPFYSFIALLGLIVPFYSVYRKKLI